MFTQEIFPKLELFAIRLHKAGWGRYIPRCNEGEDPQIFFEAESPEKLQAAVREMERRRKISETLRRNRHGVVLSG
jgi:hypothetical protein